MQPAAIAAGRDNSHALGLARVLRRIKVLAREFEQDADDLVFYLAETFGTAPPVTVCEQQLLGLGAALDQCNLELLRHQGAQIALIAGVSLGEFLQVGGNRAHID